MASWRMRNIETFPSNQMYLYLSLVERKVTEFYHNIDRRQRFGLVKMTYSNRFSRQLMVSLSCELCDDYDDDDDINKGHGQLTTAAMPA